MKTFQEFILECEIIEGKVEWDNPRRPLQSGLTPREKNRIVRKRLERGRFGRTSFLSFTNLGPSERDYERYGGLTLANQEQSGVKTPKERLHKFKDENKGKIKRKRYKPYVFRNLKEPKESVDYSIDEGRIPWDDPNRPLRSGWTPREKNRAKRLSLGIENPEHSPTDREMERYGALKNAHNTQKNIRVRKSSLHKNPEDYSVGRHNAFFKPDRRMPGENIRSHQLGMRWPRNVSKDETYDDMIHKRKYGAKNDEKRDKYYKKDPKGLREPK